jgi:hypothetical protein
VRLKLVGGLDVPLSELIAEAEELQQEPHFRSQARSRSAAPRK